MKKIYVKIEGMHCSHCEDTIRESLLNIKNISQVDFDGFIACLTYKGKLNKEKIIKAITDKNYITNNEYINDDIKILKDNIKLKEFLLIALSIAGTSILTLLPNLRTAPLSSAICIKRFLDNLYLSFACSTVANLLILFE